MKQKTTLTIGAIAGALAVAVGAFGAHGLKAILVANMRTETFELAVRYHFYHTFALLASGMLLQHFDEKKLRWASLSFVSGIVIFCGSLYVLALTGITWLGAITPIGGVAFITGWLFMAAAVARGKKL